MDRNSSVKRYAELRKLNAKVRVCTVALVALAVVLVGLLWAVIGLAMRAGLVPFFDFGYGWFDAHVVAFFGLL